MRRAPPVETRRPGGELDPRVTSVVHDGGWAGLAAAAVGLVLAHAAGVFAGLPPGDRLVASLRLGLIGLGLALPFAVASARTTMPVVPAGMLYGAAIALIAGATGAGMLVAAVAYGATLGMGLGAFRRQRSR